MKKLFIFVLLTLFSVCAHSALYKCVDPNGQKRFSDRACAEAGGKSIEPAQKDSPETPVNKEEGKNPVAIPKPALSSAQPVEKEKPKAAPKTATSTTKSGH